jgi:hypothetical protein
VTEERLYAALSGTVGSVSAETVTEIVQMEIVEADPVGGANVLSDSNPIAVEVVNPPAFSVFTSIDSAHDYCPRFSSR